MAQGVARTHGGGVIQGRTRPGAWGERSGPDFTDRQRTRRKAANRGRRHEALPAGETLAVRAIEAEDPATS